MRTLGWMQNRIRQNNNEQSIHVSARRSYSFYSAPWELNKLQHSLDANINSADFKQLAHGVTEYEKVEMSTNFFHQFLTIGTLGSVLITKDPITPKDVMHPEIETEKESDSPDNELQYQNNKTENLGEKDTKENSHTVVCPLQEYSETTVTKEEAKKPKSTSGDNLFKRYATCYKRSGKLDKGVKRETHTSHFMKKMLKKFDFTSCHSTSSAGDDAINSDSTNKKPIKFQKSRKIHPQAADHHVTKSHNYEVKKIPYDECYANKVTLVDVDNMDPQAGMLKNETASSSTFSNRPINSQPDGKKGHWIKNDANCK